MLNLCLHNEYIMGKLSIRFGRKEGVIRYGDYRETPRIYQGSDL